MNLAIPSIFKELNAFDYVTLAILLIALVSGWARGLIEVVTGFVIFALTTVLAGRFSVDVAAWLEKTWGLQTRIAHSLESKLALPPEAYNVPANGISWRNLNEIFRVLPLPETYRPALANQVGNWPEPTGSQSMAGYFSHQVAGMVVQTIVFVLISMGLGWILIRAGRLVSRRLNNVAFLGDMNRLLGAAAVGLETVVFLALFVGMMVPVLAVAGTKGFMQTVDSAKVTPYLLSLYRWLLTVPFGQVAGSYLPMRGDGGT